MIDGKKVLAIVPARGGSKGLPRKNVRSLAGRPLVAWPISAALGSKYVDKVICSTDDEEIATAARDAGAQVPFLRPAKLADDFASSVDVVFHVLDTLEESGEIFDYVVLLEPTSPLTESGDVDSALEKVSISRSRVDAVVGVSKVESTHPEYDVLITENGLIRPYAASDFTQLKRRQEIDELYFLDGSLYISDILAFRRNRSFYHGRTLGYIMPRWKSFEVDELVDLVCVEAIMLHKDEFLSDSAYG